MRIETCTRSPEEIYEAEIARTRRLLQTAKQNASSNNDLYAAQVANLERRLRMLRLPNRDDMRYRAELSTRLPHELRQHPKAAKLRFHGTPITSVGGIIKSGVISSAADRHCGTRMSNDVAGKISITTCENVGISVRDYMGPLDYAMPLGCLFAIEVTTPSLYTNWNMPNVPLTGTKLFKVKAILTSPESAIGVRKTLDKYGYNPSLATECFAFCK